MIFDHLENISLYVPANVSKAILDYIYASENKSFENSKNLFLKNVEYFTKNEDECVIETHNDYVDIQIIHAGEELIKVYDRKILTSNQPYNIENDVTFYENNTNFSAQIKLQNEYFCVFFPMDAHQAGMKISSNSHIKKMVFKVLKELFENKL